MNAFSECKHGKWSCNNGKCDGVCIAAGIKKTYLSIKDTEKFK
jgi:hypothetical protein